MSRSRLISTEISGDKLLALLAAKHGPMPLLLYSLAIPHADDWGRLRGDATEFALQVCPALFGKLDEIEEGLRLITEMGLWRLYTVGGGTYIAFPRDAWFKYQNYINAEKRDYDGSKYPAPPGEEWKPWSERPSANTTAQKGKKPQEAPHSAADSQTSPKNPKNPQESPRIPASPSPSPSPSPTPTVVPTLGDTDGGLGETPPEPSPDGPLPPEEAPTAVGEDADAAQPPPPDEPMPPPPGKPPRSDGGDAPLRALMLAYREEMYPNRSPDFHRTIPGSEWRKYRLSLREMHEYDITPDLFRQGIRTALRRWPKRDMVTPRSVASNWTALMEPDEPPRQGSNGNGSVGAASAPDHRRFGRGNTTDADEVERAQRRFLDDVPPGEWERLDGAARKRLNLRWISADTLCAAMLRLWRAETLPKAPATAAAATAATTQAAGPQGVTT